MHFESKIERSEMRDVVVLGSEKAVLQPESIGKQAGICYDVYLCDGSLRDEQLMNAASVDMCQLATAVSRNNVNSISQLEAAVAEA
jgi:hypothetical protein